LVKKMGSESRITWLGLALFVLFAVVALSYRVQEFEGYLQRSGPCPGRVKILFARVSGLIVALAAGRYPGRYLVAKTATAALS